MILFVLGAGIGMGTSFVFLIMFGFLFGECNIFAQTMIFEVPKENPK